MPAPRSGRTRQRDDRRDGENIGGVLTMVAGGGSSAMAKTITAPLERTRMLLQNQNMISQTGPSRRYTGFMDVMRRLPKEEGFRSFWRGNLANCLRIAPTYALRFLFFDKFRQIASISTGARNANQLSLRAQIISGSLSGAMTTLFTYPLDFIRTRLAVDPMRNNAYRGVSDVFLSTISAEGVRGLYKGLLVSVIEITPYTGIVLGGYHYFKPYYEHSILAAFFGGCAVGMTGSIICYPLDTIKRQLMLDGARGLRRRYGGSLVTCALVLYAERGLAGFYGGCLINASKSAPTTALTFVFNEMFKEGLGRVADAA